MTAEQFIKSHFKGIEKETWFPAMVVFSEEYAEQQAIEFEEFINQEYMVYDFDEDLGEVVFKKAHWPDSKEPLLTIKQLYQKFKEEQK